MGPGESRRITVESERIVMIARHAPTGKKPDSVDVLRAWTERRWSELDAEQARRWQRTKACLKHARRFIVHVKSLLDPR